MKKIFAVFLMIMLVFFCFTPVFAGPFLQWNPAETNQETDSAYSTDALRTGGISVGAIMPSAMMNKMFYQWSTMSAAIANAVAHAGHPVDDSSLSNLEAILYNIVINPNASLLTPSISNPTITGSDSGTETLANKTFNASTFNSPAITGTVSGNPNLASSTANTQASADNSTKLATTAYVQANKYPMPTMYTSTGDNTGDWAESTLNTWIDFPSVSVPIVIPVGFKAFVMAGGNMRTNTSGGGITATIWDDNTATRVGPQVFGAIVANIYTPFSISAVIVGDGGSHTFRIAFLVSSYVGQVANSGGFNPWINVIIMPSN